MSETDLKSHNPDRFGSIAAPFRVGVVPVPGYALMSYASTVEPLRAANLLSRKPLYEVVHFGEQPEIPSSGAAQVARSHMIGDLPALDLLVVVAGGDPFAFENPHMLEWLRKMAGLVPLIGGVSGGPVILAKAGLMSGRHITVHWEYAAELAELSPDAIIERRLYVMDRDRVTCGGGTAPIDLMHALISQHHGAVFARLVSDWYLHTDIRAAGAPQRGLRGADLGRASSHVVAAVTAMENHIADPLSLDQLALMTGVTDRHLTRLFRATFGQSAMEHYRKLRLDVGRRLVQGSSMPIAQIADVTGFSTPSHFSNLYKSEFNIRPKAERLALAGEA